MKLPLKLPKVLSFANANATKTNSLGKLYSNEVNECIMKNRLQRIFQKLHPHHSHILISVHKEV